MSDKEKLIKAIKEDLDLNSATVETLRFVYFFLLRSRQGKRG